MNGWRFGRALRAWLFAAGVAAAGLGHAGPPPWAEAPYSYFADRQKLETVLADFAGSFSLSLNLPPDVTGVVNGRFTAKSPTEFISRLAGVYGFTWYTHAGTLFIGKASDLTTRAIPVPGGNPGVARKALMDLGVLEPRFGWGELADQGLVLVSGPPRYVDLVELTLRNLPARLQHVAVFRLKHASAEDRTVLYRDREITTPGLVTVLRNLVMGRALAGASLAAPAGMGAPLRPAAGVGAEAAAATPGSATVAVAPAGTAAAAGAARIQPSIQSDPRLNAIIVQDVPERMPIYERLVAELDVPMALVEIEAMIIDVNTERTGELGINWAGRSGRSAAGFGQLSEPRAGTLVLARGPEGGNISASSLTVSAGNYLLSQLRILETDGDAQIQGRPSILTNDNTGALLDLSETFYVRVQGERVATVTPITAGTTLRVTPRVIREGDLRLVQLTVDIEDGAIQEREIDTLPTVRRSTVSTQTVVRQEEVLVIAGYAADQNVLNNSRVPLLGDLPGVGAFFSNKTRTIQKRERLFMIRPRVVAWPGEVTPPQPAPTGAAAVPFPPPRPNPVPQPVAPPVVK